MNTRYKSLKYMMPLQACLHFIAGQNTFAEELSVTQGQSTSRGGSGNYQDTLFGADDPLKLPVFKSGALKLAQNTAETQPHSGAAPVKMKSAESDSSLAAKATNPIANLMQFQLQNTFIPDSYDSNGYSNAFVIQPVIPVKFSDDGFFKFGVTRTTLPIITTPDPNGPVDAATGLGDTTFLGLPIHEQKMGSWGSMWGVGIASVIPTATDKRTGAGQFSLGPSAVLFLQPNKKWQTGVLAYHIWDVVGKDDRPYVSKSFFQPY